MFRRRIPLNIWQKIRQFAWPRTGWLRAIHYIRRRVLRLSAHPHTIALGLASGVFVSALPFVGIHLLLAAGLAWVMRANIIASAVGTAIGNPVTFPFIWLASFQTGQLILDRDASNPPPPDLLSISNIIEAPISVLLSIIVPMTTGGIVIGIIMGILVYYPCYWLMRLYQRQRLARILAQRARRRATKQ